VDIDPSAVDIAKLRLWLSLVVDEDNFENIKPLPNLDYKIMQGNSLLEEFEGVKLFYEKIIAKDSEREKDVERLSNEEKKLEKDYILAHRGDEFLVAEEANSRLKEVRTALKKVKTKNDRGKQTTLDDVESVAVKLVEELKKLHDNFFNESNTDRKKQLKETIDKTTWELIEISLKEQGKEDVLKKVAKYRQSNSRPFFLWKLNFEDVFESKGGFDVVIGNPPYGAEIEKNELSVIKKKLFDTNNSNSAALFIDFGINRWKKEKGTVSFIVPKSLLYSERWFSLVKKMAIKTKVIVDVEKAFQNVKLEQVVFVYGKLPSDLYNAKKFKEDKFINNIFINVKEIEKYKAWLCDVSEDELKIANKIITNSLLLETITETKRGYSLQKQIKESGNVKIIGGKNLKRFYVDGQKGFISDKVLAREGIKDSFIKSKKIMSQNIVAHIQNPRPHMMIISALDQEGGTVNVDTINNTIILNDDYDYKYILALLNSKLINWYAYKFIYCAAIRTMHLDSYYIGKIPICIKTKQNLNTYNRIINLTEKILKNTTDCDTKKLDELINLHYGLTDEEVEIIDYEKD